MFELYIGFKDIESVINSMIFNSLVVVDASVSFEQSGFESAASKLRFKRLPGCKRNG